MTTITGAESLLRTLVRGGVDVCFTNPGTSEMHFVAALDRVPEMRAVLGLFEGVCTAAADGYARMAGKPAATLLHLGPGLGNGLANLHNARRAHTPMVNIVGEHATFHLQYDAPLTADIEGIARTVSHWVRTTASAAEISRDAAAAIRVARTPPGQIATLIVPADASWNAVPDELPLVNPSPQPVFEMKAVEAAARALTSGQPALILMAGEVLLERGLRLVSRVAAHTGAQLMANRPSSRLQKGAGRTIVQRLAYPVPQALQQLDGLSHIILIGTRPPVSFFGYPDSPGWLAPEGCQFHTLARPEEDYLGALEALVDRLGSPETLHETYRLDRPDAAVGALAVEKVWQSLAHYLPEEAIICDESITSGRGADKYLAGAPPHDLLMLTGGAIGIGMPLATGAAIACPDRKVVNTQADGSAMYTIQALWTQAREQLNIVTILFNNRAYRILQGEFRQVEAGTSGVKAQEVMQLDNPELNFCDIAQGMGVAAARVSTTKQLTVQLEAAMRESGPYLIEVMVP